MEWAIRKHLHFYLIFKKSPFSHHINGLLESPPEKTHKFQSNSFAIHSPRRYSINVASFYSLGNLPTRYILITIISFLALFSFLLFLQMAHKCVFLFFLSFSLCFSQTIILQKIFISFGKSLESHSNIVSKFKRIELLIAPSDIHDKFIY